MVFEIWCIGDMNYLAKVLEAVAMLSNDQLFGDLFRVGLLIAVLLMGFQALYQTGGAGGLPWGRFILAIIAYGFLFGTTATVQINDTYKGAARSVDNVPFGVAATGSFISQLTHALTEKMEQAYGDTDLTLTDTGFAGPLEVLAKGRNFIAGLEAVEDGKIVRSLVEYTDKCTSTGINMGFLTVRQIKLDPNPWKAMKWESTIYYAKSWVNTADDEGVLLTCTEAWGRLNTYLNDQLWGNPEWNKFLQGQICNNGVGGCDVKEPVQAALDYLAARETTAVNYMLAAVLLPVFEQGQIEFN